MTKNRIFRVPRPIIEITPIYTDLEAYTRDKCFTNAERLSNKMILSGTVTYEPFEIVFLSTMESRRYFPTTPIKGYEMSGFRWNGISNVVDEGR